jgi:hypothetical protein
MQPNPPALTALLTLAMERQQLTFWMSGSARREQTSLSFSSLKQAPSDVKADPLCNQNRASSFFGAEADYRTALYVELAT